MVKTPHYFKGHWFNPWSGNSDPTTVQHGQNQHKTRKQMESQGKEKTIAAASCVVFLNFQIDVGD